MRYEGHLSRQFDQAQYELAILQMQRRGEAPPIARWTAAGRLASRNCRTNQEPDTGGKPRRDNELLSWTSTVADPG
jgi:hypothetical protein